MAGLDASFFDTWTGDPFSFAALTPAATTGLLGFKYDLSNTTTVSVSIEQNGVMRVAEPSTFSSMNLPDVIGRARWSNGSWDLVATAAAHRIDFWAGLGLTNAAHDWGYAAKAYVKYNVPTKSDGSFVLAQATYGDKTPAYLGISADTSRRARFQLSFPDTLTAKHFEHGHGWSADLVGNYAINDQWQTGAFVSLLDYSWYSLQSGGEQGPARVRALRTAWNLQWSPIQNFTIAAEVGIAHQQSNKVQNVVYPVANGTIYSGALTISRNF